MHPRAESAPLAIVADLPPHERGRAPRYLDAAARGVDVLEQWLGPLPADPLIVRAVPWDAAAPGADRGVGVPHRWLVLRGDRSLDRFVVAGLVRLYWSGGLAFAADDAWFGAALARFTAVRAIHASIDGDHAAAPPVLGGVLAIPVRSAPLSADAWEGRPARRTFDEVDWALGDLSPEPSRTRRAVRALQTIERYLGPPVLDAALRRFAEQFRGREARQQDFLAIVEESAGRDLRWLFEDAFREEARYDYGVAAVDTSPGDDGRHHARVVVARLGNAAFPGTSRPSHPEFEQGRGIAIDVAFADGTEVREHWDGRESSRTFDYFSRAPVVSVVVDPEAILLLDENWDNNRWSAARRWNRNAAQWALLWMAWVQDAALAMTAVL